MNRINPLSSALHIGLVPTKACNMAKSFTVEALDVGVGALRFGWLLQIDVLLAHGHGGYR